MTVGANLEASSKGPFLRLYVAGATPNSVRAQRNLADGLARFPSVGQDLTVEIIDVFVEPKRAMKDGVLVTPTLVASRAGDRTVILGDLCDAVPLLALLAGLTARN